MSSTFEANAQKKTTYSKSHLYNKVSSFISNILFAVLVLTCSQFQVGIKILASQADRAHARLVTLEDCPSDCIGARALHA
jgi:hypothetical protein